MSDPAKLAAFAITLTGFCAATAGAQSSNDYPNKKYQIQQQQADTDHMRAETEAKRAAADADRAKAEPRAQVFGSSGSYVTQHLHISGKITNDFAFAAVPVYLLPNGVKLRVSGVFRPYEGVRCISYCENAPAP